MLRCEQQAVGQKAGPAVECALGADAGKFGEIVAFREVAEDDVGGLAVVFGFEVGRGSLVGEVSDTGEDSLLDGPGIRAVSKHLEVVVRFDQKQVDGFELGLDVGRDVAEVGGYGHAHAFRMEDEAYRVGGVVRDCKRAYGDVADLEGFASLKVLHGRKRSWIPFRGGLLLLVWSARRNR